MLWFLFICRDHGEGMDGYLRQHYQEQEQEQPQTGNGVDVGIPISGSGGGGGYHHLRGSSAPNATTNHLSSSPVKKVQFQTLSHIAPWGSRFLKIEIILYFKYGTF
jgi:hypothetical protein